ncbi:hypothetical protein ABZP36_013071 [Zizania latifolia]
MGREPTSPVNGDGGSSSGQKRKASSMVASGDYDNRPPSSVLELSLGSMAYNSAPDDVDACASVALPLVLQRAAEGGQGVVSAGSAAHASTPMSPAGGIAVVAPAFAVSVSGGSGNGAAPFVAPGLFLATGDHSDAVPITFPVVPRAVQVTAMPPDSPQIHLQRPLHSSLTPSSPCSTQQRRSNASSASSSGSGNGTSNGTGSGSGEVLANVINGAVSHRDDNDEAPAPDGSILAKPPYPWATNRVAMHHSMSELSRRGITTVDGESQCRRCDTRQTISYDIQAKFDELVVFIFHNYSGMHDRAPARWINPTVPDCANCGQKNSMRPVIPAEKDNINWIFLLLGQALGLCTLDQLKHFCAHTRQHRTGAKDRVLYLTYFELCNQLLPGIFDAAATRKSRSGIRLA